MARKPISAQFKARLLADLLDQFDQLVQGHSVKLTREMIRTFLQKLSTEDGSVANSAENMRRTALIDRAWASFQGTSGMTIVTDFLSGLTQINDANLKYYRSLSDANIKTGDIRNIINARLGIDDSGHLVKDGYTQGLLDDVSVRNEIKKFTYQKIISGTGYEDLRTGLQEMIQGTPEKLGTFERFYRNFAYDTYVQVDRLNSTLYAEKLGLKYFIYQGTRREASRYFCIHRKGKVFTTEEAEEWHKLIGTRVEVAGEKGTKMVPAGPIVADPASYNPFVDLGGFGCVDTIAYISEEIAFAMRPELRPAPAAKK